MMRTICLVTCILFLIIAAMTEARHGWVILPWLSWLILALAAWVASTLPWRE